MEREFLKKSLKILNLSFLVYYDLEKNEIIQNKFLYVHEEECCVNISALYYFFDEMTLKLLKIDLDDLVFFLHSHRQQIGTMSWLYLVLTLGFPYVRTD